MDNDHPLGRPLSKERAVMTNYIPHLQIQSSNICVKVWSKIFILYYVVKSKHDVAGSRKHRGCIIPQAVTHSLVLLKMDKIIARNMLS